MTFTPFADVAFAVSPCGAIKVGAVVSATVTANEPLAVFPAASRAVQVTVVVPSAKVEPEAAEHVTVGAGSTTSVALAA